MSVQGGIWNFDGRLADQDFLANVSRATARWGPDRTDTYSKGAVGMFYGAFHTTKESRFERQPYVSHLGNVLTWDGRLDNREELVTHLSEELFERTDVAIVMAAYERWGTDCFRKIIGDWALALWNQNDRLLILAKDFMGPRHLYYRLTRNWVFWCTHLEPMVLLAGHAFEVNGEYIAGYFDSFPAAHLTPYVGIDSVTPGTFLQIKNIRATSQVHWRFDPNKKIRYRTDAEYEEHFRAVFKQAVTRRLRSDSPVLSELSGGMDSTSIVCMGDMAIAQGEVETPRLDTISYYHDEEPNWDERPYFTKVEQERGRTGAHIDLGLFQGLEPLDDSHFVAVPGMVQTALQFEQERYACMKTRGDRVLLSGIGGDEVMGGVPAPTLELADLLVELRLTDLGRQLKVWSLAKKQPWSHLLLKALMMSAHTFHGNSRDPAPWLARGFLNRYQRPLLRMNRRISSGSFMPSQEALVRALNGLKNLLASTAPPLEGCYEQRYPYMDRDLVEFMISIPREQVLRPKQRRSLMRRSLADLVPAEIVQRKRKAYVIRRPLAVLAEEWPKLQDLFRQPFSGRLGFLEPAKFSDAMHAAIHGKSEHLVRLDRTVKLELWLRSTSGRGDLLDGLPDEKTRNLGSATQPGHNSDERSLTI